MAAAAVLAMAVAIAAPPNFVVLFMDDNGWGDLGANNPK
jgi:arylsulfatase A-like enzyme